MAAQNESRNGDAEVPVTPDAVEAEAKPADEPAAEQVPQGEPVAETTAEEAAGEAELAGSETPAAEAAEVAGAPSEPKRKKKRLPRALR